VLLGLYRTDEAMALLEPAVQELADIDDEQSLATLNGTFGRALVFAAQPERAMGILDGVLEIAERRGMPAIAARSLMTKGSALSSVGRQREGLGMLRAARELAGEYGLTELYLRGTVNLCAQLTEFDVAGTVDQVREAIALARRGGHRSTMLTLISNLGYTGFLAGVWDEAMAAMEPLLAEDISTRDRVQILNNYIIIRAARGEAVESDLAELERLTRDMTSRAVAPMIADPSANAALAAGDATAASDWYRKIGESEAAQGAEYDFRAARVALWDKDHGRATELFDRFERTGGMSRVRDARMATLRAGLAALEGRPAEALPLYREALRTWRDVGAVWDEAQTGIEMAILLDASEPDVSAAIASTRDILERLRAKPYLERLDQAASAVRPTARSVRGPSRAEVVVTD
jgi:tetratricopeptide (TPR) repeat protein